MCWAYGAPSSCLLGQSTRPVAHSCLHTAPSQPSPPPPQPPQQQQQQQQAKSLGGDASSSPIERQAAPMMQRSPPRQQLQRSATWSPMAGDTLVNNASLASYNASPARDGQEDGYKREIGLGMLLERNSHEPHITRVREVVRNLGADQTQQVRREHPGRGLRAKEKRRPS